MATHLVTGGSGFVGSNIARVLHSRGEKVRILDIIDSPDRPDEIEFVKCDILDRQGVQEAMKGVDYVHHNVALVPLTKAGSKFWEVNVEGTQVAVDAAKEANVKMFIHMSSSAIFGGALDECPITDETPPKPIEIYGRAKLAGEQRVREAAENGLPCAIIRPRTILGLGRLGIFQLLFEWIRDGKSIYVIGKGDNLFQFLHIDDLVNVSVLCVEKDKPGIYNIGTDRYSTLREDLSALIRHAGTDTKVVGLPATLTIATLKALDFLRLCPLAPWHYLTYHKPCYFDISKPMNELGWEPKYSNVEMMTQAYDWFIENYDKVKEEKASSTHRSPVKQRILKFIKWFS